MTKSTLGLRWSWLTALLIHAGPEIGVSVRRRIA
jgi:hypothetical protein